MFRLLKLAVSVLLLCSAAPAHAVEVLDAAFLPDVPFPEYSAYWSDSTLPEPEPAKNLGGNIQVFIRNTGQKPIQVEDVLFEGISLKRAIAFSNQRKFKKVAFAASIYFSDLADAERNRLIESGEPVWWKVEPQSIAPSQCGQIIIRLRRAPKSPALKLALRTSDGTTELSVSMKANQPRIQGISFSKNLDQVYLYLNHPKPGTAPTRVFVDGADVTVSCSIGMDKAVDVVPVVCPLKSPLERASFHCFQAIYADGLKATAGIRAWNDDLAYGIWGGKPGKESEIEIGRAYVNELGVHNISVQMEMLGSDAVRAFMNSGEGKGLMNSLGIGRVVGDPGKWPTPYAFYIADEPDTADYRVEGVPATSKIGSIAQGLIARAIELRKAGPSVPNMLNVDMTFKPENWYTYGRLPDIFAADPYYQTRLAQVYWETPGRLPLFAKATFVHAVGRLCQSACAPNPLHLILNSTRVQKEGRRFRFGTPEEKRIEVYYALAAGAKGLSYWWYTPITPNAVGSCGCGADDPGAKALWREIGLLGAEVRTLESLISRSCPASTPVSPPRNLWVRTLLAGKDSLIVLCVNDNYLDDRVGTFIKPVEIAETGVTLPSWLDAKSVFEVDFNGTHDVKWDRAGLELSLHLEPVAVTRLIVISSDPGLRDRLQKTYETKFAANVAKLSAGSSE